MSDVAVIGGGIVGCALAAFLAEGGAQVVLYEREAIAAGASGRNSGVVQHPLDPALIGLYEESLEHYRTLGHGLRAAGRARRAAAGRAIEPLEPVPGARRTSRARRCARPSPRSPTGSCAYRLETGRPVPPAAAAHAFAARAREAGARLEIGAAEPARRPA